MCPQHHSTCGAAQRLIFACSGAADVGHIADLAARQLAHAGHGKMSCLAGFGAGISSILDEAQAGHEILAIDGCSKDCARRILEDAGIEHFEHFRLTDLGLEKGKSPASYQRVAKVLHHITQNLRETAQRAI